MNGGTTHCQRLRALSALLIESGDLWRPQPFRETRPGWVARWPALAGALQALTDDECAHLTDDGAAARAFVGLYVPELAAAEPMLVLPETSIRPLVLSGAFWDWEIPGRKRAQLEAFAGAVRPSGRPLLDWCGGKGHLGRLLALAWRQTVTTLEINPALCAAGVELAKRAGVMQMFACADALDPVSPLPADAHVVALHACGELHRQLLRRAVAAGVVAVDLAPCCHYHGVETAYVPLSGATGLGLSRDDLRLAVTETVTASPRIARRAERERAWKLAFVAWREYATGAAYQSFKPVSRAWMGGTFVDFFRLLCAREGVPLPSASEVVACEAVGWRRLREVDRHAIVRHAVRRPIEMWLVSDLAVFLERSGYAVELTPFCPRHLTPRNLLLSARKA